MSGKLILAVQRAKKWKHENYSSFTLFRMNLTRLLKWKREKFIPRGINKEWRPAHMSGKHYQKVCYFAISNSFGPLIFVQKHFSFARKPVQGLCTQWVPCLQLDENNSIMNTLVLKI